MDLHINDIVYLNSGSPPLKVIDLTESEALCSWGSDAAYFPRVCLTLGK